MFNNMIQKKKIVKAKSELELKQLIKANEQRWEVASDIKYIKEQYYNPFQVLMKLKEKEVSI